MNTELHIARLEATNLQNAYLAFCRANGTDAPGAAAIRDLAARAKARYNNLWFASRA